MANNITPTWQDHEELMKMFPPPLTFHPTQEYVEWSLGKGGGQNLYMLVS